MEEFKGDKRTKAYKEYKKKLQADIDNKKAHIEKGLGDKVEQVFEKTGIKTAVKKLLGDDCGCDKRKQILNKKLHWKSPIVRCMTQEQYNQWQEFRSDKVKKGEWLYSKVTLNDERNFIVPLYIHLFAVKYKPASCCVNKGVINAIDQVFNYE